MADVCLPYKIVSSGIGRAFVGGIDADMWLRTDEGAMIMFTPAARENILSHFGEGHHLRSVTVR